MSTGGFINLMCHAVRIVMFKPMAPPCLGLKGGQKEWKDYHIRVSDTADAFRANANATSSLGLGQFWFMGIKNRLIYTLLGKESWENDDRLFSNLGNWPTPIPHHSRGFRTTPRLQESTSNDKSEPKQRIPQSFLTLAGMDSRNLPG